MAMSRIVNTREVHSRHRHDAGDSQEYGAQVLAPSRTGRDASSATQSSLQAGSVQRADQAVDEPGSLLQLRGDVVSSAGVGLHRDLDLAQGLCASPASTSPGALPRGAL